MQKHNQSGSSKEAKNKLRDEIYAVLEKIKVATDHIPQSVRNGSIQTTQRWKQDAVKWRMMATKQIPDRFSEEKLTSLLAEAKAALASLSAGAKAA